MHDPVSVRAGELDLLVEKHRSGRAGVATVAAQLHYYRLTKHGRRVADVRPATLKSPYASADAHGVSHDALIPVPPPPVKVCPACSIQTQTDGGFCPHCGQSYQVTQKVMKPRRKLTRGRRRALVAAVIVLTVAGGCVGAAIVIDHNRDAAASEAAAQAQREADQKAREAAQARSDAKATEAAIDAAKQRMEDEAEEAAAQLKLLDAREDAVESLQKMVLKDAKEKAAAGHLEGPILKALCMAQSGDAEDDPDAHATVYECVAATEDNGNGNYSGHRYEGSINWYDGTMTSHLAG